MLGLEETDHCYGEELGRGSWEDLEVGELEEEGADHISHMKVACEKVMLPHELEDGSDARRLPIDEWVV